MSPQSLNFLQLWVIGLCCELASFWYKKQAVQNYLGRCQWQQCFRIKAVLPASLSAFGDARVRGRGAADKSAPPRPFAALPARPLVTRSRALSRRAAPSREGLSGGGAPRSAEERGTERLALSPDVTRAARSSGATGRGETAPLFAAASQERRWATALPPEAEPTVASGPGAARLSAGDQSCRKRLLVFGPGPRKSFDAVATAKSVPFLMLRFIATCARIHATARRSGFRRNGAILAVPSSEPLRSLARGSRGGERGDGKARFPVGRTARPHRTQDGRDSFSVRAVRSATAR